MATNTSENRNIEARLVMDNTGNWKLIGNATAHSNAPQNRSHLLKVTGPDGKIKFFYGNTPTDGGGISQVLKERTPASGTKLVGSKPVLTESQAKSLAILLSSVKSKMSGSGLSGSHVVGGGQVVPRAAVEETRVKGFNISVTPHGIPSGQSNQVILVSPGKGDTPVRQIDPTSRSIQSGNTLVPVNFGEIQSLNRSTTHVINQSPQAPGTTRVIHLSPQAPGTTRVIHQPPKAPATTTHVVHQSPQAPATTTRIVHQSPQAPDTKYVIHQSPRAPSQTTSIDHSYQTNVINVPGIHQNQHGMKHTKSGGNRTIYKVLSNLLENKEMKQIPEDGDPSSNGNTCAKLVENVEIANTIPKPKTSTTDRHVDPILNRFATSYTSYVHPFRKQADEWSIPNPQPAGKLLNAPLNCSPNAGLLQTKPVSSLYPILSASMESNTPGRFAPSSTLASTSVATVNQVISAPQPSIFKGDAGNVSCTPLVLVSGGQTPYYMPLLAGPSPSIRWVPVKQQQHQTRSGSSSTMTPVPGHVSLPVPMVRFPSTNSNSNSMNKSAHVGMATKGSLDELHNQLISVRKERENSKKGIGIPNRSLIRSGSGTEDTQSTLRISSIFSLKNTAESVEEVEPKLEFDSQAVNTEIKDSGSTVTSGIGKSGSTTEDVSVKRRRAVPLIANETISQSFGAMPQEKKPNLEHPIINPCFVVLEHVKSENCTVSKKTQRSRHCSRFCRERFLMRRCHGKDIVCNRQHIQPAEMNASKRRFAIRRKIRKVKVLKDEVDEETNNPFDTFLKNLVKNERQRLYRRKRITYRGESSHAVTYYPSNEPGKLITVVGHGKIPPRMHGLLDTVLLKPTLPDDEGMLPYVPAPAAFEDIAYAEEVPISPKPHTGKLCDKETDVAKCTYLFGPGANAMSPEDVASQQKSPSSVTETSDLRDSTLDERDAKNVDDDVTSECDGESPRDMVASHAGENRDCVQMDTCAGSEVGSDAEDHINTHAEREGGLGAEDQMDTRAGSEVGSDADDIPVAGWPTEQLPSDTADAEDNFTLHQSDVSTSINEDSSNGVFSEAEVADLKSGEKTPEEDSDDDWGTTELEVDPDSEREEEMDILDPGSTPAFVDSVADPELERNIGSRANDPPTTVGNDRIARLKAMLEEQTKKVDSLRRFGRTK